MNEKRKELIKKVLEKIHNGEIICKDKLLPERKIAEMINESRPILREGLIALEAIGVLDIRDRQGIFLSSNEENEAKMLLGKIKDWPADMLSRGMEIRQIIEPPAAGIAAIRHTEKDIEKLKNCLDKMSIFVNDTGPEAAKAGAYWNTVYHVAIVAATGNSYLTRVYEGLFSMLEQGLSLMRLGTPPKEYGGQEADFLEHQELARLIVNKESAAAELYAEEHLSHTVQAMVRLGQIVPSSDLYSQKILGHKR